MYGVDASKKTAKLKKAYVVNANKKTEKLKKCYVVGTDKKLIKLWSGFTPMFVQAARDTSVSPYAGLVRYSENGQSWTTVDLQLGNASDNYLNYNTIAFGNGVYVAAFWGGYLAYSTDGVTWTKYTAPQKTSNASDGSTTRVFFCNGKFILYMSEDATYVYTSTDGVNWSYVGKHGKFGGANYSIELLEYGKLSASGGNVYIAVLNLNGYGNVWYSTDLLTWTSWNTSACAYNMHMKPNHDYPFFVARINGTTPISNYYYNTEYSSWSYGYFDDRGYSASVYNEDDNTIYFYSGTSGGYLWKWDIGTENSYYSTVQGGWISSDVMPINAVHGNGLFVGYTTDNMVYSTDGQTWTIATAAKSDLLNTDICFGGE